MAGTALRRKLTWQVSTLVEARPETAAARTLVLDAPEWAGHRAGQHIDLRLTADDGYQAQRSYSIASAPQPGRLEITVERLPDGEVSPYLVDDFQLGDQLELRGPIGGYFVWDGDSDAPLLLVAGGSGVVPLMSMIRRRAEIGRTNPTRMLYSAHGIDDVIYREELDALAAADPRLEVIYVLTRRQPPGWTGYARRIDREILGEVAWGLDDAPEAFVCGPTRLVESVATQLQALGYPPERIRTERFGPTGG